MNTLHWHVLCTFFSSILPSPVGMIFVLSYWIKCSPKDQRCNIHLHYLNLLRGIYSIYWHSLWLQGPTSEIKGAANTFYVTIKYFSDSFKVDAWTHKFSSPILRNAPLQWTKEERKVVSPHYKTIHQKVFCSTQAKDKVTQLFLQQRKTLQENGLKDI